MKNVKIFCKWEQNKSFLNCIKLNKWERGFQVRLKMLVNENCLEIFLNLTGTCQMYSQNAFTAVFYSCKERAHTHIMQLLLWLCTKLNSMHAHCCLQKYFARTSLINVYMYAVSAFLRFYRVFVRKKALLSQGKMRGIAFKLVKIMT